MNSQALILTLALAAPLSAVPDSNYRITHTYSLGGDGGWDYIIPDPPNHRLFIARQNRVMVVPADAAGSRRRGPVLRGSFAVMVIERDPSARIAPVAL